MSINRYIVSEPGSIDGAICDEAERKPDDGKLCAGMASANEGSGKKPGGGYARGWARIEFDTKARKCRVYKRFSRTGEPIGMLPYNKALAYCKEHLEMEKGSRGL